MSGEVDKVGDFSGKTLLKAFFYYVLLFLYLYPQICNSGCVWILGHFGSQDNLLPIPYNGKEPNAALTNA